MNVDTVVCMYACMYVCMYYMYAMLLDFLVPLLNIMWRELLPYLCLMQRFVKSEHDAN